MSITKVPDEELLIFDHEIAAPVEQVFGAFLNPNLLHRWYGPTGWRTRAEDIVLEPYVGGMQRLSMINELDASVSCVLQSRFLAIEPLKELEYAEQLPDHLGNPGGVVVYQRFRFFPRRLLPPMAWARVRASPWRSAPCRSRYTRRYAPAGGLLSRGWMLYSKRIRHRLKRS